MLTDKQPVMMEGTTAPPKTQSCVDINPQGLHSLGQDTPRFAGISADRHRDSGAADKEPGIVARPFPCSCDGDGMTTPNTPQTEKPKVQEPLVLNSRADLRELLVSSGLARAAADKIATAGWKALAGEPTETDLIEEVAKMATDISEFFRR